jgi:L-ascorbate oxidase
VLVRSGETETILVNGQSYRSLDAIESETPEPWSEPNYSIERTCGPEVIEVEPDKVYRIRAVGGQALSLITFAIEDHEDLSVIAADASYTQEAVTDRIQIASGQRFDFLLRTKSEVDLQRLGKSKFWVQLETRYRPTNVTSYALLSYKTPLALNRTTPSSPPTTPRLTITNDIQGWLEYALEPFSPNEFPSAEEVTRQVFISSDNLITNSGVSWSVNNRTWTESDEHLNDTAYNITSSSVGMPYLVNIYVLGEAAIPNYDLAVQKYGGWDPMLNVYAGKVGEVIDIIMVNEPNGYAGGFDPHPWHIHGSHAYDIGSGPGTYNASANEERLKGYNPVLRDTTVLYKYTTSDDVGENEDYKIQGWRAWRLRVDNPGYVSLH